MYNVCNNKFIKCTGLYDLDSRLYTKGDWGDLSTPPSFLFLHLAH